MPKGDYKGLKQKKSRLLGGIQVLLLTDYSADTFPLALAITSSAMLFGAGA
jgi:hypothetical protein